MEKCLSELKRIIEEATSLTVGIGHPSYASEDLILWPWRISTTLINELRGSNHPLEASRGAALEFLLLSKSGIGSLVAASSAIAGLHRMTVVDAEYVIAEQMFPAELQISIFASSDVPLQPCFLFMVTG